MSSQNDIFARSANFISSELSDLFRRLGTNLTNPEELSELGMFFAAASIEETVQIDFTTNSGIYEKVEEFYMMGAAGEASKAFPNTTAAATGASSAPTPLLSINNAAPNVPIFGSGTVAAQQGGIFSGVISPNNMFARQVASGPPRPAFPSLPAGTKWLLSPSDNKTPSQGTPVNFAAIPAFIPSGPKPAGFASRSATKVAFAAPSTPSGRTGNGFSYSAMRKGEKKRPTKKVKISFSAPPTFVHFIIDDDKDDFQVHKNLVCQASPYFAAAFNGSGVEATSEIMRVVDVDTKVFGLLVNWMYNSEIEPTELAAGSGASKTKTQHNPIILAKLHLLAHRASIPQLQDDVMQLLVTVIESATTDKILEIAQKVYAPAVPLSENVSFIKTDSTSDITLKRLLVDHISFSTTHVPRRDDGSEYSYGEYMRSLPADMVADIADCLRKVYFQGGVHKGPMNAADYYSEGSVKSTTGGDEKTGGEDADMGVSA